MYLSISRVFFTALFILLPQVVLSAYVFTAPPRESSDEGYKVYNPIAVFLTTATGQQFIYRHQSSWTEYVKGMRKNQYDLVFDGPHFVDWRVHNMEHNTLIKIPHLLQWQVIARKNNASINKLEDLAGKKVCAPGSPNFGMLNLFSHFNDADKQPIHVEVKGWNGVYEGVKNGDCVAGVMPKKNHQMYDRESIVTKSIHTHLPYPNQAITASKRVSEELKEQIRSALLSDEGQQALENLRKRYSGGSIMTSADDEEYDSIQSLLKKADSFNEAD